MMRPAGQIQPCLQLALAQHDELSDHASQSNPENHENEFCQNGGVIGCHENFSRRMGISSRDRAAGSPDRQEFCFGSG
jgi:hypothetical protein